jgi:hypothetical protein
VKAIDLLFDLQYGVMAHALSGGDKPVHTFLNLKPIKLKTRTVYEKKSMNIRIYLDYGPRQTPTNPHRRTQGRPSQGSRATRSKAGGPSAW